MLTIHTSNRLEQLTQRLALMVNTNPLKNVLSTETIIVQNAGMGRYLSMQIADISGISANMEYLFPAEFMWRLLRLVSDDVSKDSPCAPDTLRFFLMKELCTNVSKYPEIQHYITDSTKTDSNQSVDEMAAWDLSCELSQAFDQYLYYRSEWIRNWEGERLQKTDAFPNNLHNDFHDNENWQARLWKRCVKDNNLVHWLALQDQFKNDFNHINTSAFPERIIFFSMSALSPGYMQVLGQLAQKIDVHLYVMNPCEDAYWGDIQSTKAQTKLSSELVETSDVGHNLLATLGIQGRDFIHELLNLPNIKIATGTSNLDSAQRHNHVLNQLQQDIYNLTEARLISDYSAAVDNSIRFNACHTQMREVEVIHDQILECLESDSELVPADIIVMMPNIDDYAPYIDAIFSTNTVKLPYSLADSASLPIHHLVEVISKVFSLIESRFDVESVFEILDNETIQDQFSLDSNAVGECRDLAKATNIRWGINEQSRAENNLPQTEEHTWKYAIDRLLLGYMMGDHTEGERLFKSDRSLSLLPFNDIEGNNAVTLSHFKRFTDILFEINTWNKQNFSIDRWIDKAKQLFNKLFASNNELSKIFVSIDDLVKQSELADFDQTIPFHLFQQILKNNLQSISGTEQFLGHGITFCALVPMRSVPFKIIALMGMNDGEFPRQDKHNSFDLMAKQPRKGDRSRRNEDRYLFLESILATRSKLIISYIGQSAKDNSSLPPSVLVSELIETLNCYTGLKFEDWITKHPLQAFSPQYFTDPESNSKLFSFNNAYTHLHEKLKIPSQTFISEKLPDLDESFKQIDLAEFIKFYQSPARAFLNRRLSITTFTDDLSLPICEPFDLERFNNTQIRNILMSDSHEDNDQTIEKNQYNLSKAKGLLPYGDIGKQYFDTENHTISNFKSQLPTSVALGNEYISLSFYDEEFNLSGELTKLTDSGRIIQQVSQPYFHDYIEVWISHLILNHPSVNIEQRRSHFHSPELSFSLNPITNAEEILSELIKYYWKGLHFPLLFFPKSGLSLYKDKGEENIQKGLAAWHGNTFSTGEKEKYENWLLHRTQQFDENNLPEEFLDISQLIYGELYSSYIELS